MFSQWKWLHSYSPVRSEDSGTAPRTPMQLSNWLLPRRVRTALVLGLLLAFVFLFSRYSNLPERLQEFAPSKYHDASVVAPQNCSTTEQTSEPLIRWSEFAYVQYVTNANYLCNSLMILEALHRLRTKADLLMMYPRDWEVPADNGSKAGFESKLLAQARDRYNAKLVPVELKTFENKQDPTWQDSYTKLLAFNQTQYKRVISLDSDATVLQHMDELFLLPSAPVAMPRAYWMDKFFLSSQLIVIEPSETEWGRVEDAIEHHEGTDYDMDILNKMYDKSCTVIPHRKYDLLTGEFRGEKHESYLGSPKEKWDPRKALKEASYLHFSDWPMPKPWLKPSEQETEKHQPDCRKISETEKDCSDQEVWLEVRKEFSERRQRICGRDYDGPGPATDRRRSNMLDPTRRSKYEPVFA